MLSRRLQARALQSASIIFEHCRSVSLPACKCRAHLCAACHQCMPQIGTGCSISSHFLSLSSRSYSNGTNFSPHGARSECQPKVTQLMCSRQQGWGSGCGDVGSPKGKLMKRNTHSVSMAVWASNSTVPAHTRSTRCGQGAGRCLSSHLWRIRWMECGESRYISKSSTKSKEKHGASPRHCGPLLPETQQCLPECVAKFITAPH